VATGISDEMVMRYVIHDALRRDLGHLSRAVESRSPFDQERRQAFGACWELFKSQLHGHHSGEGTALWPTVRPGLADRPDDLQLLGVMESEHARIGPLIVAIDAAVADLQSGAARLPETTALFSEDSPVT